MISKVSAPNSVPTDISDYVAQNAHMMAFMNQVNMQAFVLTSPTTSDKPKIALGSYISHGGSLYKVETSDEDIAGSPSDGKVYVRVTGDATLSASFVTDISSYNYNHAYGTLTSGGYTLLPYEIRKSGSSWLKYRYDATGPRQLLDQNLRTTDGVIFSTVNTGHGANELYPMNQPLRTTDSPTFNKLLLTSAGDLTKTVPYPTGLAVGATYTIPQGIYYVAIFANINTTGTLEAFDGSDWFAVLEVKAWSAGMLIISDGAKWRIRNKGPNAAISYGVTKFS